MSRLVVVSATRLSQDAFWKGSALGQSLLRLGADTSPLIAFDNSQGLPSIYNYAIDAAPEGSTLVFVHDDVWLDDFHFAVRIAEGLDRFDAIGIAGNRRRVPRQPAWHLVDTQPTWDDRLHLSGSVAHGDKPFGPISRFGPAPAACELLDGVLLAIRRDTLVRHGVRFDERFLFHFYDLDFCRSLRQAGLSLGTWPIALTHQSGGFYENEAWRAAYAAYLAKWPEDAVEAAPASPLSGTGAQTPAHEQHNPELLALIPASAARVLEVGCSSGALAREFKKINPAAHYTGFEIDPRYAELARRHCDAVRTGNIEQVPDVFWHEHRETDCWIFGDTLEHLVQPWTVLRKIRSVMKAGSCVVACIPNMQHWSIQARLNAGQIRYEDSGLLDRTHLRWFSGPTMYEMFRDAGLRVEVMEPRIVPHPALDTVAPAIRQMAMLQGQDPEVAVQRAAPLQYVLRAVPD